MARPAAGYSPFSLLFARQANLLPEARGSGELSEAAPLPLGGGGGEEVRSPFCAGEQERLVWPLPWMGRSMEVVRDGDGGWRGGR